MLPLLLLFVLGAILALWIAGFAATTDLSVQPADVRTFKNVLAVFAHADDETVTCGGTIRRLASSGARVSLLLLTAGERGNASRAEDPDLKAVRQREAERACRLLGVSEVIEQDFGDGLLAANRDAVAADLAEKIRALGPDLILTYDTAGLDGHPDHVACSEIAVEIVRTRFPNTTLWCVAPPRRLVRVLQLVGQLPAAANIDQRRMQPTARVFLGAAVIPKIRAWYAYRTQRASIAKGLGRFAPVWFAVSTMQFEYFARAV